ncbi:beta-mannanase [Neobacillus niacini]|uniref:beta-mannanase n=1 Tax=Neobacillus niacini TaxID=86668 RepID=UPI002FFEB92B
MNWEPIPSPGLEIKNLKSTIRDSVIHLTWFWPNEIDFVYIYKAPADRLGSMEDLDETHLKLYTREEYKANQGYLSKLDSIGKIGFQIFPCQKREGKLQPFIQENDENLIFITGEKAKIYYSISYKKKLFQNKKKVKMSIMTELPLDKELLCYVRKRGSVPISKEDGTYFPFIQDFPAGKTQLVEMEIAQNEFIRVFFSQGKKSAEIYELIPD